MTGFVDLHCHWVSKIDDGARDFEEGIEMLRRLRLAGFAHVTATPHMRPGMFNNDAEALKRAYRSMVVALPVAEDLPTTSLGSEHFFDSEVLERIRQGQGLPYRTALVDQDETRTSGAILVEFHDLTPLKLIEQQLFQLQSDGFLPVIAHPERYRACWQEPAVVERLVDLGSVALLDAAALVGKYGSRSEACAKQLLEMGVYAAACSDAHRPSDVDIAVLGMKFIEDTYGAEEIDFLFREGPLALLNGLRPE